MKKAIPLFILLLSISATLPSTVHAQFRNHAKKGDADTTTAVNPLPELPAKHLLDPGFLPLRPSTVISKTGKSTETKKIYFSNTAKLFLRMGTDLIRGSAEDIPLYSFENSWKYPGPTVKYPETAHEQELFLERYQRYTSDN